MLILFFVNRVYKINLRFKQYKVWAIDRQQGYHFKCVVLNIICSKLVLVKAIYNFFGGILKWKNH